MDSVPPDAPRVLHPPEVNTDLNCPRLPKWAKNRNRDLAYIDCALTRTQAGDLCGVSAEWRCRAAAMAAEQAWRRKPHGGGPDKNYGRAQPQAGRRAGLQGIRDFGTSDGAFGRRIQRRPLSKKPAAAHQDGIAPFGLMDAHFSGAENGWTVGGSGMIPATWAVGRRS